MIVLDISFDSKLKKLFKDLDIKEKNISNFCNFILNEYKNTRKTHVYNLDVKGIQSTTSGYYFGSSKNEQEAEMELCLKSGYRKIEKRRKYLLQSFFHELIHFRQDKFDNISGKKLDYTEKDVTDRSPAYWDNPFEVEARELEEKLYDAFEKIYY